MKRFDRNTRNRARRRVPVDGWKTQHTEAAPARRPATKPRPPSRAVGTAGLCACPQPHLTAVISGHTYLAEPCEHITPAAAIYTASCGTCGGTYDKPWRRIRI
ncbi:hypothetical protein AB0953_27585 [Streptomyces sp. NPDC046866]|uniref:hypothetical protein n=1 Tax=Streptomyces sp. NPDC046866 TaxID=3154921 RepID=UPI00345653E8